MAHSPRLILRIAEDDLKRLRTAADRTGQTISDLARDAIVRSLRKTSPKAKRQAAVRHKPAPVEMPKRPTKINIPDQPAKRASVRSLGNTRPVPQL